MPNSTHSTPIDSLLQEAQEKQRRGDVPPPYIAEVTRHISRPVQEQQR